MSEIFKIGIPTLLFQILTSLSISMMNSAAKEYGGSALAAMGPLTKIMSMGSLVVFGFLKGFQPIAGYSYGAKNLTGCVKQLRPLFSGLPSFCAAFGLAVAVFPAQIMGLFTKGDTEMIRVGTAALRANGISFFLLVTIQYIRSSSLPWEKQKRAVSLSLQAGYLFYTCHFDST